MKPRILVVDDERDMLAASAEALEDVDAEVVAEHSSLKALELLKKGGFDLLLTDIKMPELDGVELMKAARREIPGIKIILVTAYPQVDTAVEALRQGAVDYVTKPFHPDTLSQSVSRALRELRLELENVLLARQVEKPYRAIPILGESAEVLEIQALIARIAPVPAEVLILGESGTGKELVARQLHAMSGRKGRFVPIDCGAIPESLMENELFGHEKGAFTDARVKSEGLLDFAESGTLFLDEVCELPLLLQAKLLRVLQERQFRRVGARELRSFNVRVLAATNRDIDEEVRLGRFREDLYFRINSVQIQMPPLRDRPRDIALLAKEFVLEFAGEFKRPVEGIDEAALRSLECYRWPGNVRQLRNVVKRAVALCESHQVGINDLQEKVILNSECVERATGFVSQRNKLLTEFESAYFGKLLARHQGNAKSAAAEAGIPLSSFYRFLKKYDIGA